MKYLKLKFRNAGWFPDISKSKDRAFDLNGQYKRSKYYVEPITMYQISNMLHVLMGERPKPSLRESYITTISEIDEIAKNSWLKINEYKYTTKNGYKPITEIISIKKSLYNAHNESGNILYWKRIEKYLSDKSNLYNQFIDILNNIFNTPDITIIPFTVCMKKLFKEHSNNPDINSFKVILKKNDKTDLVLIIENKKNNMFSNSLVRIVVNNGIEKIVRLNGDIIVPIQNDIFLSKIENSKGFASLLDGGLVTIDTVIDSSEWNEYFETKNFKKVSEISSELKTINN